MTATVTESASASPTADAEAAPVEAAGHDDVLAELLIEEISIDGMCGVY
jgi:mycofactocin precursor